MAISEFQLRTWSNIGATTSSARAYASINTALFAVGSPLLLHRPEVFLQGSYANSTNIYGDSDVDVVVLYADSFHFDLSLLTPEEQVLHRQTIPDATYHWRHLQADVLTALRSYYGTAAVVPGKKAIKVATGQGRLTADVIPALQHRRYSKYAGPENLLAYWGIQFFDTAGNAIVNYPKDHIKNGEEKNAPGRTNGEYKPTIRIFKNLRNHLETERLLGEGVAPSYFIEGALFNVPDQLFGQPLVARMTSIVDHLARVDQSQLTSQNGLVPLIGAHSTQWRADQYAAFVNAARSALG